MHAEPLRQKCDARLPVAETGRRSEMTLMLVAMEGGIDLDELHLGLACSSTHLLRRSLQSNQQS